MIRVLALVPYPLRRAPGQRYRIEQWAPRLREHGVDVEFEPFLGADALDVLYAPGHLAEKVRHTAAGYARRVRRRLSQRRHDVAYVYRECALLAPGWLDRTLAGVAPFVFDFDDAIYLPAASAANAWTARLKGPARTAAMCAAARHVMVGNEVLAAWARPRARGVTVVPSTIDIQSYAARPAAASARPVVGWTGSQTTLPYLEALAPALRALHQRIDFELQVIGAAAALPQLPLRLVPWRADTEAADVAAFHVGLMPLPDDDWARGKCGMKALQYMALGIPPVVSPVGANATIVTDGVDGFHARTPAEWVDRIELLLRDEALRARLGAAARRTVASRYSADVVAPAVAAVLHAAARDDV